MSAFFFGGGHSISIIPRTRSTTDSAPIEDSASSALCTDKRTPLDLITKSENCPQADASSNPGVRRPVAKSAIAGFMRVDQGNPTGRSAEMVDFLKTVDRCGNAFHSRLQLQGQKLRVVA